MTLTSSPQLRVNELTRRHSKAFYSGGSYGLSGYIFIDLLDHEYATACVVLVGYLGCG